jgi:hypothetical protein
LKIDFDAALELAWDWVGSQGESHILYQELTEEHPWGWVFYWGVPLPDGTRPQRQSSLSLKIDRKRGQVHAGNVRRRVGTLGARLPHLAGGGGLVTRHRRRPARVQPVASSSSPSIREGEENWRCGVDPVRLLRGLSLSLLPRKSRLLACACARNLRFLLAGEPTQAAVAAAEAFADGLLDLDSLRAAQAAFAEHIAREEPFNRRLAQVIWQITSDTVSLPPALQAAAQASSLYATGKPDDPEALHKEQVLQADLVRDVFGNPYNTVIMEPMCREWRESLVVRLARSIYDEHAFDRMPILGDALEEAGCTDADVLGHCHAGTPHTRGCWVLDLVLELK